MAKTIIGHSTPKSVVAMAIVAIPVGPPLVIIKLPYSNSSSTAAAGHNAMSARAAPQRYLANRHALRVSEADSYALLFFF